MQILEVETNANDIILVTFLFREFPQCSSISSIRNIKKFNYKRFIALYIKTLLKFANI